MFRYGIDAFFDIIILILICIHFRVQRGCMSCNGSECLSSDTQPGYLVTVIFLSRIVFLLLHILFFISFLGYYARWIFSVLQFVYAALLLLPSGLALLPCKIFKNESASDPSNGADSSQTPSPNNTPQPQHNQGSVGILIKTSRRPPILTGFRWRQNNVLNPSIEKKSKNLLVSRPYNGKHII